MEALQTIGIIVALVIGFAWYLKNKQKDSAKEGTVLEMKQRTQEQELAILKKEMGNIPEQEASKPPANVIDFWNKKK